MDVELRGGGGGGGDGIVWARVRQLAVIVLTFRMD